ncbi:site-specific integrase [Thiotrichales bacterium 19X7-9]|nr:site-specific integrase [Thiotrichales bacterium 19X7-9]
MNNKKTFLKLIVDNKPVDTIEITKELKSPTSIMDLGYSTEEQQDILNKINQAYIKAQKMLQEKTKITNHIDQSEQVLSGFKNHLTQEGLAPKTIKNHIQNLEFFLKYLNRDIENTKNLTQICADDLIGFFEFFSEKAMWASEAQARSNISSFKKLFKWLYEGEKINKEEYTDFKELVKSEKEYWIEMCSI